MSVLVCHLASNSNFCSIFVQYRENAGKHKYSTLLIPYEENPLMTNGLNPQRASNTKIINYAIPWQKIYLFFINIMETKENKYNFSTTVPSHEYQRITYHNRQYRKTRKKTIRLRTTHAYWGETTSDQWNLNTKGHAAVRKAFIK